MVHLVSYPDAIVNQWMVLRMKEDNVLVNFLHSPAGQY